MEELLKAERVEVQKLMAKYFTVDDWLQIPEMLQLRHLQMTRNYVDIPEGWKVNPMPKPDFMVEKPKGTTKKLEKTQFKENEGRESRKLTENQTRNKLSEKQSKILEETQSSKLEVKQANLEEIANKRKSRSAAVEKRNPKRNVPVRNYYEEKEPENDRYIFCDTCQQEYLDFCPKCGMLISLPNNPVPLGTEERATKTLPKGILEIKQSKIHGKGVFALKNIQCGVRMGPYEGEITRVNTSQGYAWKLRDGRLIDGSDETTSNYLRYVNCARNVSEQNIMAFQYKGNLFYRTCRYILEGEELLVYYGTSFAKNLGIDTKKYFEPNEEYSQPDYFCCQYCAIGLSTIEYRNTHEKYCKFHPDRLNTFEVSSIFTCKHCQSEIASKQFLEAHEKRCPKNEEVIKKKNQKENNSLKSGEKCDYCEYVTNYRQLLQQHIKAIHEKENAERYPCDKCDYKTYYKSNLQTHIKKHKGIKGNIPFICSVCNKKFSSKRCLDGHYLRYHPNKMTSISSKVHTCKLCLYKTLFASNLTIHMLTHNKETKKLYSCDSCNYSSNEKGSLKKHLLIHSRILPYICKDCKRGFNEKKHLDSHILNKHKDNEVLIKSITNKIHRCNSCTYQCIRSTDLKRHLQSHLNKTEL